MSTNLKNQSRTTLTESSLNESIYQLYKAACQRVSDLEEENRSLGQKLTEASPSTDQAETSILASLACEKDSSMGQRLQIAYDRCEVARQRHDLARLALEEENRVLREKLSVASIRVEEETWGRTGNADAVCAEGRLYYLVLSGKRCSGKSTTAQAVWDEMEDLNGYEYRTRSKWRSEEVRTCSKFAFSAALYEACYARGMSRDPNQKDMDLLLKVAREMKEQHGEEVFVNHTLNRVRKGIDGTSDLPTTRFIAVIEDCRLPVELSALRAQGRCFAVRLEVSPEVQRKRILEVYGQAGLDKYKADHITETALDGQPELFDLVINTDVVEKEATLKQIMHAFLGAFPEV